MNENLQPIHDLTAELRRLDWCKGVSDEALSELLEKSSQVMYGSGDPIIEIGETIEDVYFIVRGTWGIELFDSLGKQILRTQLVRGNVVGLFTVALSSKSAMEVRSLEPSAALRIKFDDLLDLTSKYRDMLVAILKISANIAKAVVVSNRERPKPAVVCIVHQSLKSRGLTERILSRLKSIGEKPCVAGDASTRASVEGVPFRLLVENLGLIAIESRLAILKEWSDCGRLFIDVSADLPIEHLAEVVNFAEEVLWCVEPSSLRAAANQLEQLERRVSCWSEKISRVWILGEDEQAAFDPAFNKLSARDFKVAAAECSLHPNGLLSKGIERLVHHLRGVMIGLALGGGAARGMAHLGVLEALEDAGVFVDRIAGTSAGAMTGTVYAHGMSPSYATKCFKNDLLPSWFFRMLPGGGYWYLLYKYRWNLFDPMLRKYLGDSRMEQLLIPMTTVSVDLVDGVPLVRTTGDATANILESINLPPLSLPIIDSERAVVDGGLLNNVPANILLNQGCNFVIASTVTAQLEKDFMGIRSQNRKRRSKLFSTVKVIMRQNMIQSYNMNSVGIQPADVVIAPDVTGFDLSEFTRADEMAVIGKNAANAKIHKLREMLSKLDPFLFPFDDVDRPTTTDLA